MPIHASHLIISLMLVFSHWMCIAILISGICSVESCIVYGMTRRSSRCNCLVCDSMTSVGAYRLQSWFPNSSSHSWGLMELTCRAVVISPYLRLIVYSRKMKTEHITCRGHCFWFPRLGEQFSAVLHRWSRFWAHCIFCRKMFLKTVWFPLWVHQCPSSSANHGALWRSSMITAWFDSRCRMWCRTQLMREMMLQSFLIVCWKLHQWVYTAISLMCLISSKYTDISYFESVIREVGEHQCLLKTRQLYQTVCGRHAALILCQLLHVWISGDPNQLCLLLTWPLESIAKSTAT